MNMPGLFVFLPNPVKMRIAAMAIVLLLGIVSCHRAPALASGCWTRVVTSSAFDAHNRSTTLELDDGRIYASVQREALSSGPGPFMAGASMIVCLNKNGTYDMAPAQMPNARRTFYRKTGINV